MNDRIPGEPGSQDFREAAERSQAAGIADESAGYVNALAPVGGDASGADAGGAVSVPEGLAVEAEEPADMRPDESDSIEPFHIPGSAEDIHVDGETEPGPSGGFWTASRRAGAMVS